MGLEAGTVLEGVVVKITHYGAFVEFPDGKSGLVHISEIADTYVKDVRDYLKEQERVKVLEFFLHSSQPVPQSRDPLIVGRRGEESTDLLDRLPLHPARQAIDLDRLEPRVDHEPPALLDGVRHDALELFQHLLAHDAPPPGAGSPARSSGPSTSDTAP